MSEFSVHQIPAVVLVAPAWERAARATGRALSVSDSQIIILPLGELFPDSADAAKRMRDTAHEVVQSVVEALKKSCAVPAR